MTDEEIVFKYLNRNFLITEYNPKTNSFEVGSRHGSKCYNIHNELHIIFNGTKELDTIYKKWLSHNTCIITNEINVFFNDCTLVLGQSNWEVVHSKYGKIRITDIKENFGEAYGIPYGKSIKDYCLHSYRKWYQENIYLASEKAMRNF